MENVSVVECLAMKKLLLVTLLCAQPLIAQHRPVNTFSIVARDPQTGQIGVAVQSHWFAVGQIVPWAEAGIGAVATQSFVDPSYGQLGLDLLRTGKAAPDALRGLLGADPSCEVRQVAMIDANGNVASFTGAHDIQAAGGVAGGGAGGKENGGGGGGGGVVVGPRVFFPTKHVAEDKGLGAG